MSSTYHSIVHSYNAFEIKTRWNETLGDFSDFFEQLQMYTSGMMGPVTQIKLHD